MPFSISPNAPRRISAVVRDSERSCLNQFFPVDVRSGRLPCVEPLQSFVNVAENHFEEIDDSPVGEVVEV